MGCIEVAWRRDAGGVTHIDDHIEDLLGYTVLEIKNLLRPIASLAPWAEEKFEALLSGMPDKITSHIYAPYPLRHKLGFEVNCEVVLICRYDERGDLAELFGLVRNYPHQEMLSRLLDCWRKTDEADCEAICGLAELLTNR